jgi:hypothetical protein
VSDKHHHEHHHKHRRTHFLGIAAWNFAGITIKGAHMDVSIAAGIMGQAVIQGYLADGITPSGAVLSNLTFSDGNPAVASGALDATTPNAIDETALTAGTSVLSFSANFVDTNGATGTASGTATITVTGGTGPTPLTVSLQAAWTVPAPASALKGVKLSR